MVGNNKMYTQWKSLQEKKKSLGQIHWFSITPETNYHKPMIKAAQICDYTILEVRNPNLVSLGWICVSRAVSFWKPLRRIASCLFQLVEAPWFIHSLAQGPFPPCSRELCSIFWFPLSLNPAFFSTVPPTLQWVSRLHAEYHNETKARHQQWAWDFLHNNHQRQKLS